MVCTVLVSEKCLLYCFRVDSSLISKEVDMEVLWIYFSLPSTIIERHLLIFPRNLNPSFPSIMYHYIDVQSKLIKFLIVIIRSITMYSSINFNLVLYYELLYIIHRPKTSLPLFIVSLPLPPTEYSVNLKGKQRSWREQNWASVH